MVSLRQFPHNIVYVAIDGLVSLGCRRFWHVYLHVLLLEYNSIPEHFHSQLFVKIAVRALRILGVADIVGDVCRTVRFGEEIVFSFSRLLICIVHHCGESIDSSKFFCWGASASCLLRVLIPHFVEPLLNVEEIIHLIGGLSTLGAVGVVDVL